MALLAAALLGPDRRSFKTPVKCSEERYLGMTYPAETTYPIETAAEWNIALGRLI